jgi:endo-1,4-beta-D-glucanase Y
MFSFTLMQTQAKVFHNEIRYKAMRIDIAIARMPEMAGTTEFHQPGQGTLTMKIDPVKT